MLSHPELLSTNVNWANPKPTPVTNPLLSTVATLVSDDVHSPPTFGNKLVVDPIHISEGPLNTVTGFGTTVIPIDGSDVHEVLLSKVNETTPGL